MQPPASSAAAGRGRTAGGQRKKLNEKTDKLFPWRYAKQGLQQGWLSADVRFYFFIFFLQIKEVGGGYEER